MSTKITPTVGRIVWFTPGASDTIALAGNEPLAAIIANVVASNMVNLTVFGPGGSVHSRCSAFLVQDGDPIPAGGHYCQWMPYQKGQAAKTDDELEALRTINAVLAETIKRTLSELDLRVEALRNAHNRQVQDSEIPNHGPRVTPAEIEAEIASEWYFTAVDGAHWRFCELKGDSPWGTPLEHLTFCVLVLRNGFTVVGTSACASPENFAPDIGRRIARQDAVRQVWPLLGFRLRDKIGGEP